MPASLSSLPLPEKDVFLQLCHTHNAEWRFWSAAASVKLMYAPQPQPKQIQALSQFTVTKVACGQNHTLALTQEGQAFSWGRTLPHAICCKFPVSLAQRAESSAQFVCDCPKALCQVHLTKATHLLSYANACEVLPAVLGKTDWASTCALRNHFCMDVQAHCLFYSGNGGYGRLGHVKQQDEFKPRNIETFNQRVPVAPDVVSKLVSDLKATSTQNQRRSIKFSTLFCRGDCFGLAVLCSARCFKQCNSLRSA